PLLRAARNWIGDRPIRRIQATMEREARTEAELIEHTGLHVVDVVRAIGGIVASSQVQRAPGGAAGMTLVFATGATGTVDLRPRSGIRSESLQLSGEGFCVEVRSAEFDRGNWRAWRDDRLERDECIAADAPLFVANGTLAETEAFLDALRTGRPM